MRLVFLCFYVFLNFSAAQASWSIRSNKFHVVISEGEGELSVARILLDKEVNLSGLQVIRVWPRSLKSTARLIELLTQDGFEPLQTSFDWPFPEFIIATSPDINVFYDFLDILSSSDEFGPINSLEAIKNHESVIDIFR